MCYSCNNWLINWHSQQQPNPNTSGHKSKSNKSIPEEQEDHTMVIQNEYDQYLEATRLREKLQKYLYKPGTAKITTPKCHKNSKRKLLRKRFHYFKCNLCGVTLKRKHLCITTENMLLNNKCLRFCGPCKRGLSQYFNEYNNDANSRINCHHQRRKKSIPLMLNDSSPKKLVNPYVLSRLKKLGTTVVREGSSAACKPHPFKKFHADHHNERQTSSPYDNEIVISFNTTLTEVFPLDLTKKDMMATDEYTITATKNKLNLSDVIKRIPPTLTISLA